MDTPPIPNTVKYLDELLESGKLAEALVVRKQCCHGHCLRRELTLSVASVGAEEAPDQRGDQ